MFLFRADSQTEVKPGSHAGRGQITRVRLLGEYDRNCPGFRFVHDNVLAPGTTIGAHTHTGDEELWLVVCGRVRVVLDGDAADLGPGDACLVRDGGAHQLEVIGPDPARLLVICANL